MSVYSCERLLYIKHPTQLAISVMVHTSNLIKPTRTTPAPRYQGEGGGEGGGEGVREGESKRKVVCVYVCVCVWWAGP